MRTFAGRQCYNGCTNCVSDSSGNPLALSQGLDGARQERKIKIFLLHRQRRNINFMPHRINGGAEWWGLWGQMAMGAHYEQVGRFERFTMPAMVWAGRPKWSSICPVNPWSEGASAPPLGGYNLHAFPGRRLPCQMQWRLRFPPWIKYIHFPPVCQCMRDGGIVFIEKSGDCDLLNARWSNWKYNSGSGVCNAGLGTYSFLKWMV